MRSGTKEMLFLKLGENDPDNIIRINWIRGMVFLLLAAK